MNKIDKWAAEQCGFELIRYEDREEWVRNIDERFDRWTIQDPQCREIVRKHFLIETWVNGEGGFTAIHCNSDIARDGKTIAGAEIACITAIYKAAYDKANQWDDIDSYGPSG